MSCSYRAGGHIYDHIVVGALNTAVVASNLYFVLRTLCILLCTARRQEGYNSGSMLK